MAHHISNLPPGVPGSNLAARRPPAHRSVSLKHESLPSITKSKLDTSSTDTTRTSNSMPPRRTATNLVNNKTSSGESSNAEHWFEQSNRNVAKADLASDGSPPFLIQNSSTDEASANAARTSLSLPYRAAIAPPLRSTGSSSEEYRSVIDDLTIRNKRLKKRLRAYEKLQHNPLGSEAMFEVKINGLSREKKRELEKLLADFAMNNTSKATLPVSAPIEAFSAARVQRHPSKPSSSMTSGRADDSGYGSLSVSNQGISTTRSSDTGRPNTAGLENSRNKDRNIHSYLHDIPEGLLPKPPNVMTESSKKKLIVRRLEQIFGGVNASNEGHQQPLQQQSVSAAAAEDDRRANEARGQRSAIEGKREALIMDHETEEPMDFTRDSNSPQQRTSGFSGQSASTVDEMDIDKPESSLPQQRPTRPLDLDPHREQIPAENIDYIRHLGFKLPPSDVSERIMDDQGWIYLNLMVNLAQLHTINVTTELVRQALKDYSQMFELSADGRKIRWRGSQSMTNNGANSNSGGSAHSSVEDASKQSRGEKRLRPAYVSEASRQGQSVSQKKLVTQKTPYSEFTYTPIFRPRQHGSDDQDSSIDDDESDSSIQPYAGESSALATSSHLTGSGSRQRDDGPLVFYKEKNFFTDLSGDKIKSRSPLYHLGNESVPTTPLGKRAAVSTKARSSVAGWSTISKRSRRRYFATDQSSHPYHQSSRPLSRQEHEDIKFDIGSFSPKHVSFVKTDDCVNFQVSGINGVYPEDNVDIKVVRSISAGGPPKSIRRLRTRVNKNIPTRSSTSAVERIISVKARKLEPSTLPEPSYAYSPEDSNEDSDLDSDDVDGHMDVQRAKEVASDQTIRLPVRPNRGFDDAIITDSEEYEDDDEDEEDSDDEVDFLAAARAANPAAIHAREREYDAAMAERLAEEIPAGSSAATAGGGSGFNSPVGILRNARQTVLMGKEPIDDNASVSS